MVTKAIIESVTQQKDPTTKSIYYKYKVRIPIFHGVSGGDATPKKDLPEALAVSLPHGNGMAYRVNDVVYVLIENYDLSTIVIIGMVPHMQTKPFRGSDTTESQFSVEDVQTIIFNREGNTELPIDTKVYISKQNPYMITSGDDFVSGEEISFLKNLEGPIQDQITSARSGIGSIVNRFDMDAKVISSRAITNLTFDSQTWLTNSGFMEADKSYTLKKISQSGGIELWSITDNNKTSTFTKATLQTLCGIKYTYATAGAATITIQVTSSPLPIRYGGLGADNKVDARKNLEVYKDQVLAMDTFENRQKNNMLDANTIYYLYTEESESDG